MELIESINLMDDKKLIRNLNLISIPLFILFFVLFTVLTMWYREPGETKFTLLEMIIGIVSLVGIIILHELIHGIFFKLFNTKGKVKFGFKNGLAYATSPNSFYSKGKFQIILLEPFVLNTLFLYVLYHLRLLNPYPFVLLASIHASACVGDFYFSYLIVKAPKNSLVEDTEQGISFYKTTGVG